MNLSDRKQLKKFKPIRQQLIVIEVGSLLEDKEVVIEVVAEIIVTKEKAGWNLV